MIALVNMSLSDLAMKDGDLSTARELLEKSLALGQELGDKHGMIMYLDYLGCVALGQGKYQEADELISKSLIIGRELGSKWDISVALINLAHVVRFQVDYKRASEMLDEGIRISREIHDNRLVGLGLCYLGELARLQDNYETAYSSLIESLTLAGEVDDRETVVCCFEEFAALGATQEQAKRAAILFGAAEALREDIHVVLLPIEKIEVDKNIAVARTQLDETTFNAAWAEGRAMTMEQAIAYALEERK